VTDSNIFHLIFGGTVGAGIVALTMAISSRHSPHTTFEVGNCLDYNNRLFKVLKVRDHSYQLGEYNFKNHFYPTLRNLPYSVVDGNFVITDCPEPNER